MRGGPGIKNCCPWKRKNPGLIQYFSDSDLLSTGIRIQTLSSSLWTCLRCRLKKCSSTKSTKQSNKVPNQSWRSLTDYLTIWWNWHGKLVDNFSHESDVMSLQDSFTSRPWKTPFYFVIVLRIKYKKTTLFPSISRYKRSHTRVDKQDGDSNDGPIFSPTHFHSNKWPIPRSEIPYLRP